MKKYVTRTLVVAVIIILLPACGLFSSEDPHAYRNAKSINPLEMPDGLSMPQSAQVDTIPEQGGSTPMLSAEELEMPPEIVKSADLAELDAEDKNAKKQAETGVKDTSVLNITATKNPSGESLLVVDAEFDKVWSRVKPALEELGFSIDDSNRGREMYEISKVMPAYEFTDKPTHPGDEKPEIKEEFQIHVKPSDRKTRITVHNKFGEIDGSGLAEHLLLQIKELMENPKPASSDDG